MIDKKQLKEILIDLIKVCEEIRKETRNEYNFNFINYNTIFEQACSYHRQMLIPNNKKLDNEKGEKKASDKQIKFLKQLNYKGDLNLTSKEAYKIIKELTEKLNLTKDRM
jgi:hypothetical protein